MKHLFSSNLKFLRKESGKSQTDIGLLLNKAHTSIGNWEKGISEPSLSEIEILARIFEISISDLLTIDLQNVNQIQNHIDKKERDFVNLNVNHHVNLNENVEERIKENVHLNVHQRVHLNENVEERRSFSKKQELASIAINTMPKVVTVDSFGQENILYVPQKARAGYLNGYGDQEYISSLPAFRLPGFTNGSFRAFEVSGASMHPTLNDGDICIAKAIDSIQNIRNDRIHVVISQQDGIVVKRLLNRMETDNKLILKSDNVNQKHDYPNIILDPQEVIEIWYVVSYLSHIMKSPSEIYNRIIDLEGRLTILEQSNKNRTNN